MSTQKVAIITGGGRGIGAATAKLFAKQGYAVAINYKSHSEAANKLAERITNDGGKCITIQGDVAFEEDVVRMFSTIDEVLGTLSVLVNNAGILKNNLV